MSSHPLDALGPTRETEILKDPTTPSYLYGKVFARRLERNLEKAELEATPPYRAIHASWSDYVPKILYSSQSASAVLPALLRGLELHVARVPLAVFTHRVLPHVELKLGSFLLSCVLNPAFEEAEGLLLEFARKSPGHAFRLALSLVFGVFAGSPYKEETAFVHTSLSSMFGSVMAAPSGRAVLETSEASLVITRVLLLSRLPRSAKSFLEVAKGSGHLTRRAHLKGYAVIALSQAHPPIASLRRVLEKIVDFLVPVPPLFGSS